MFSLFLRLGILLENILNSEECLLLLCKEGHHNQAIFLEKFGNKHEEKEKVENVCHIRGKSLSDLSPFLPLAEASYNIHTSVVRCYHRMMW